jgi:CheY-like chemotaxis protein
MREFIVIDDDKASIFLTEEILKYGYEDSVITSFTNAQKGLDFLVNSPNSSMLFLDLNMPNMNGWDLLKKIKLSNYRGVICILSSSSNSEDFIKAKENGILFLNKPLDIEQLNKITVQSKK